MSNYRDYKKDYEEFWKDIIENEDGTINKEQLMKELSDFSMVMEFVPKVYMEITDGKISKLNTLPEEVIGEHEYHMQELFNEWEKERNEEKISKRVDSPIL